MLYKFFSSDKRYTGKRVVTGVLALPTPKREPIMSSLISPYSFSHAKPYCCPTQNGYEPTSCGAKSNFQTLLFANLNIGRNIPFTSSGAYNKYNGIDGYETSTVAMQPFELFSLDKNKTFPFLSLTSLCAPTLWR